ncbi:MAG: FAD-dependent oxidoreductase, partial [Planctomycetes bacterium]|nr:FAD-dependent oxidoreductase [Planctomycetota bacterium]
TAGALAALAAARNGAAVVACEPLPAAGGMGTAGGIHCYYFGVRGGLQDEIDEQVQALRGRFGEPSRQFGFHPLAKLAVLDRLLTEAGVAVLPGATACAVEREGGAIRRALVATPQGPLALASPAWIDGTGDGDLAAMAGARFRLGRGADAMVHAYTQSSGRCRLVEGGVRLDGVNFDSGYCDPSDPADLTRSRLQGILQYRRARSDGWDRPTYIAPAIGLREGRLVDTDRVLGMAELIEGACGDDAIALHGSHLDAHAVDMHNESDELLFWMWGCRQWGRHRTSGGIPYGCLLPVGLDNLWLAGRCLGVSHDAHYSLRMQRDLQRVGEAAGIAAALAAAAGCASRAIAPAAIRARLAPGALQAHDDEQGNPFGWMQPRRFFGRDLAVPADHAGLAALAAQLGEDEGGHDIRFADAGAGEPTPGLAMWRLYRAGARALPLLLPLLADADERRSWRAACVLAALGRAEAAPRLAQALAARQDGFARWDPRRGPDDSRSHVARDWIAACALLRLCAGWEALPALAGAAGDARLPFDAGVAIASTLARIARRHPPTPAQVAAAQGVLDALQARFPGAVPLPPHRTVNHPPAETLAAGKSETAEDHAWQLQLAVADARRACGLAPQPALQALAGDPRAHVRRAAALQLAPARRAAGGG